MPMQAAAIAVTVYNKVLPPKGCRNFVVVARSVL